MDRSDGIKLCSSASIPPFRRPELLAQLARANRSSQDYGVRRASATILPGSGLDPVNGPTLAVGRLMARLGEDGTVPFGPVVVREQADLESCFAWVASCITVPLEVVTA